MNKPQEILQRRVESARVAKVQLAWNVIQKVGTAIVDGCRTHTMEHFETCLDGPAFKFCLMAATKAALPDENLDAVDWDELSGPIGQILEFATDMASTWDRASVTFTLVERGSCPGGLVQADWGAAFGGPAVVRGPGGWSCPLRPDPCSCTHLVGETPRPYCRMAGGTPEYLGNLGNLDASRSITPAVTPSQASDSQVGQATPAGENIMGAILTLVVAWIGALMMAALWRK